MGRKHLRTYYDHTAKAYIEEFEHIYRKKKIIVHVRYPCPFPDIHIDEIKKTFLNHLENELLPILEREYMENQLKNGVF